MKKLKSLFWTLRIWKSSPSRCAFARLQGHAVSASCECAGGLRELIAPRCR